MIFLSLEWGWERKQCQQQMNFGRLMIKRTTTTLKHTIHSSARARPRCIHERHIDTEGSRGVDGGVREQDRRAGGVRGESG